MKQPLLSLGLAACLAFVPVASAATDLAESDLAALRYFLSIGDEGSVRAEIDRLETEFPGADVEATLALIDAAAGEVDTSPVWRRIEAAEYAEARRAIAELSRANAGWSPPEDMMAILDANEGQAAFDAAIEAADLDAALAALTAFPSILTCERINNPWRLAELQVAAERPADALATYEGILQTCRTPDFVVATLQKANELGDRPALEALIALARERNPGQAQRLTALAADLAPPEDEAVAAAADAGAAAPAAPAPAAAAPAAPSAAVAPAAAPAAAPARPRQAAAAAAPAQGGGGSGALARAQAAAQRNDWGTCLELTTGAAALDMLHQRAWCAYNFGRANEAVQAFRRVAESGGPLARDAGYGLVLAYARLNRLEEAAAAASRLQLTPAQRQVVNQTVISKLAVASFEAGRYRQTLDYLDRLSRDQGSLDRGLAMLRGWALLKSGQKGAAREQFRRVHNVSPGQDSHQGLVEAR